MSRIGKKPIELNDKTQVTISEKEIVVKGPLGELKANYLPAIEIKVEGNLVVLTPKDESIQTNALWGTYSSIISNMVEGVNKEFVKNLIIEGIGYKAEVRGRIVVLNIGLSHQVELNIPEGINVVVEKEKVRITGIDKQAVGEFAAVIRSNKKPEPYKGKGIRYADEVIKRKEGKKTV